MTLLEGQTNAQKVLVGKHQGRGRSGEFGQGYEYNIKMDLIEIEWTGLI